MIGSYQGSSSRNAISQGVGRLNGNVPSSMPASSSKRSKIKYDSVNMHRRRHAAMANYNEYAATSFTHHVHDTYQSSVSATMKHQRRPVYDEQTDFEDTSVPPSLPMPMQTSGRPHRTSSADSEQMRVATQKAYERAQLQKQQIMQEQLRMQQAQAEQMYGQNIHKVDVQHLRASQNLRVSTYLDGQQTRYGHEYNFHDPYKNIEVTRVRGEPRWEHQLPHKDDPNFFYTEDVPRRATMAKSETDMRGKYTDRYYNEAGSPSSGFYDENGDDVSNLGDFEGEEEEEKEEFEDKTYNEARARREGKLADPSKRKKQSPMATITRMINNTKISSKNGSRSAAAKGSSKSPVLKQETDSATCDRCDSYEHVTAKCPHFKKNREKHPDAQRRRAMSIGDNGDGKIVYVRNAQVVTMPGDGSCLFHSLAYGLGNRIQAGKLRREVANFIANNPMLEIAETPLKDWIQWDSRRTVQQYAQRMAIGGWGGGIECAACSRLMQVNVHIYEREKGSGYFNSRGGGGGGAFKRISCFDLPGKAGMDAPTINVLYCGGVHYNALVI